ncbi:hypothetical protein [Chitinophaga rhizosphaerae]|uniref:hypothetical protein n=1 Tax=Chitinophaga rhizosphaerae TaxID=1864947 RepID=UPI000F801F61|nr:hypothetical protein [Chitinophaga rhizosphaerae]
MILWKYLAFLLVHLHVNGLADKPAFPVAEFSAHVRTAEWLIEYDSAAWRLSDTVTHADMDLLQRTGKEWFVYRGRDSLWYGAYGKFQDTAYDLALHFRINRSDSIEAVSEPRPDTAMLHAVSRCIRSSYKYAGLMLGRSYVRMNKFIRLNGDRSISIYLLPALQPADVAMYGGEFMYRFDASGRQLLERYEYYRGGFKGFRLNAGREVKLAYEDVKYPTLGSVYFALRYRNRFREISIETLESFSQLMFNQVRGFYWEHREKG